VAAIAVGPLLRRTLGAAALAGLWGATCLILGFSDGGRLVLGLVLCVVLAAITLTDLERRVIPNLIVLPGAVVGIAIVAATDPGALPASLVAAATAGAGLLAVAFAHPGGMGMGDVKLAAMMGAYLGPAVAAALLVGFACGAAVGAALAVRDGAAAGKRAIPFGPFLALGGVVALWFGDRILDWYLDEILAGGG
jgi:leader peptidase (prepilin peptidase) / N-methyltransferase